MQESTELQDALARPADVRSLRLDGKGMTRLPPEIGRLRDLTTLSVARNRLAGLPTEIGRLTRLEVLDASRNRLVRLPEELGHLPRLRVLDLSVNQLPAIPDLGGLTALAELELGPNPPLVRPPHWLWSLSGLTRLGLFRMPLARIPDDGLARLRNLVSLDIGEPGALLEHDRPIPEAVWTLTNLETLSIFGSSQSTLPPALGNLTALRDLSIVETRLATIPPEIAALTRLESLSLDANRIRHLPDAIAALPHLKTLSLTGNPLAPGELSRLHSLLPRTQIDSD